MWESSPWLEAIVGFQKWKMNCAKSPLFSRLEIFWKSSIISPKVLHVSKLELSLNAWNFCGLRIEVLETVNFHFTSIVWNFQLYLEIYLCPSFLSQMAIFFIIYVLLCLFCCSWKNWKKHGESFQKHHLLPQDSQEASKPKWQKLVQLHLQLLMEMKPLCIEVSLRLG